jgi:hypothetical protein
MAKSARVRRTFNAQFKLEAVRLREEQRTRSVSRAQVGRELGVRLDPLRGVGETGGPARARRRTTSFPDKGGCRASRRSCGTCSARTPPCSRRSSS